MNINYTKLRTALTSQKYFSNSRTDAERGVKKLISVRLFAAHNRAATEMEF